MSVQSIPESPSAAHSAAPPPHVVLLQTTLFAMWGAQVASAAAQLGLADFIASGVHASDDLAREAAADPAALYRLLRACATIGLVVETSPRRFALTPVGECLRSDRPGSMRDIVIAETAPGHWLPWGRLVDAVRKGGPMTRETLGVEAWDYYAQNQDEGRCFARAMSNLSAVASADVARVYNASGAQRIVDVGGSEGVLLRALLDAAPAARGVLFDRADVIEGVRAKGVHHDRMEIVAGDFFQSVPAGGDLYLLKSILHDWPDDACVSILKTIHAHAADGAKVLIVEMVMPEEPQPTPVALMDMNMLVMLGGRERTPREFGQLLAAGGFMVDRVIPTGGMFSVIEAHRT